ncbi:MAG: tetratricopeptide repeat protein [Pseudomonadota bacterium]
MAFRIRYRHGIGGVLALAALLLTAPDLARAQAPDAPKLPLDKSLDQPPAPPEKLPRVPADRTKGLDFLFGALKAAPDEASAKHVEGRIWVLWSQTASDTTALLMARSKVAMDAKQFDVALKLLDAVVKLKPDYVEGWNRRATIYYLQNDYMHSLENIEQVLAREPRHFGALAGLGMIMQELGDDKRALDAFRRALALNPHLDKVPDLVKTLSEKVEGRDI